MADTYNVRLAIPMSHWLKKWWSGATRQQVADVIGVDVKTIYKYLPAT